MSRHLIMAVREGDHTEAESEPVVIDTGTPGVVQLELDDGDILKLDAVELRAAIQPARVVA